MSWALKLGKRNRLKRGAGTEREVRKENTNFRGRRKNIKIHVEAGMSMVATEKPTFSPPT